MRSELKVLIDEAAGSCNDNPQMMLGYLAQMALSARADAEYWKQLSREYREERDQAEERLLNKRGLE